MSDINEPTLDELITDLKDLPISGHAHAIGHLCVAWSSLESTTDLFLSVVLNIKPHHIRTAVINNINTREKWKMILSVCFLKQFKDGWYASLTHEMNRIDNDLRPERNRMVHDHWDYRETQIVRRQSVAKVYKNQTVLEYKDVEAKPVEEREIWELTVHVMASIAELLDLLDEYVEHNLSTSPKTNE